jgi:hypothetical protein
MRTALLFLITFSILLLSCRKGRKLDDFLGTHSLCQEEYPKKVIGTNLKTLQLSDFKNECADYTIEDLGENNIKIIVNWHNDQLPQMEFKGIHLERSIKNRPYYPRSIYFHKCDTCLQYQNSTVDGWIRYEKNKLSSSLWIVSTDSILMANYADTGDTNAQIGIYLIEN